MFSKQLVFTLSVVYSAFSGYAFIYQSGAIILAIIYTCKLKDYFLIRPYLILLIISFAQLFYYSQNVYLLILLFEPTYSSGLVISMVALTCVQILSSFTLNAFLWMFINLLLFKVSSNKLIRIPCSRACSPRRQPHYWTWFIVIQAAFPPVLIVFEVVVDRIAVAEKRLRFILSCIEGMVYMFAVCFYITYYIMSIVAFKRYSIVVTVRSTRYRKIVANLIILAIANVIYFGPVLPLYTIYLLNSDPDITYIVVIFGLPCVIIAYIIFATAIFSLIVNYVMFAAEESELKKLLDEEL